MVTTTNNTTQSKWEKKTLLYVFYGGIRAVVSKIRSLYYSLLEMLMIFFMVINIIAYLQTHNDVLEEILCFGENVFLS